MAILYNIKKVVLTELDPKTGAPKAEGGVKATIETAQKAELEPVLSEGDEDVLRAPDKILAVVRTDDLIYGYDVKLTDNTFSADVAGLVAGYKVTKGSNSQKDKYATPMVSEGFTGKPFKLDIYVANYSGDAIVDYAKVTLNKCIGKFPTMSIGDGFYAPEFEIKARENTKASLPTKEITFVDEIPAD